MVLFGESGNAVWLNGREGGYPVGWKGDTTEVTGVNQVALLWVMESFESARGPELTDILASSGLNPNIHVCLHLPDPPKSCASHICLPKRLISGL